MDALNLPLLTPTIVTAIIRIAAYCLYLKTLGDVLKLIPVPRQRLKPMAVWPVLMKPLAGLFAPLYFFSDDIEYIRTLTLILYIPMTFAMLWHFWIVNRLERSLREEYDHYNTPQPYPATYKYGLILCSMDVLLLGMRLISGTARIAVWAGYVAWLFFFLYWTHMGKYKRALQDRTQFEDAESTVFKDL